MLVLIIYPFSLTFIKRFVNKKINLIILFSFFRIKKRDKLAFISLFYYKITLPSKKLSKNPFVPNPSFSKTPFKSSGVAFLKA